LRGGPEFPDGKGGDDELDEQAAFNPVTPYGESKIQVERAVSRLADDNFSPVFLRNATAYGFSRRLRADVMVNNLVGHAVTGGKVRMQSDGSPWRPLVHVLDIAHAFAQVVVAPQSAIHNQAFNVGRVGENYRVRDVANLIAEIVPECSVSFAPGMRRAMMREFSGGSRMSRVPSVTRVGARTRGSLG